MKCFLAFKLPPNQTLEEILADPKRHPYFANYIGVLNGTHLLIFIKGGYVRQAPQRSKKGGLLQNVFIAINFKLNFIYIFTSQKGFAYNSRVLTFAKLKGFQALSGRYYVTNARYLNTTMTLTFYCGVWYYLYKQVQVNIRP